MRFVCPQGSLYPSVILTDFRQDKDGNTEHRDGSQRHPITSSRKDRHVIHMALVDSAAPSQSLSHELRSFAKQQVSTRTVRRRLQKHGLSTPRPWMRLPLMLRH
ncbi:HTH_Tnp_Tc3_2 domain-containing protein [Trichonephila clavipes]|nr:HTH_Tnp_Tc3_2 domain-containing protein [Trichonephila clavipes]